MPSAVKAGSRYMAANPRSPSAWAASSMWAAYRCAHPSSSLRYGPRYPSGAGAVATWAGCPPPAHPPVVGVEQPDPLAADQVHRMVVEQRRAGQRPTAALQQITGGRPSVGQQTAGLAETPRDGVYAHPLDGIEEGAGSWLAARGVRGVVRVEP